MTSKRIDELTALATPANADEFVVSQSEVAYRSTRTQAFMLATYTVATLPAAATYPRALIYVSDEAGGTVPAFSDGTNWRRVTDRAVVS